MSSYGFKEDWIPTPLRSAPLAAADRPTSLSTPDDAHPLPALGAGVASASAIGPMPSSLDVVHRAGYIARFFLMTTLREALRNARSLFGGRRLPPVDLARRSREFAERVGGCWIIFVRLASLREDLLGADYCRELARTRDHCRPLPIDTIRKLVDAEMRSVGTSFDDVFSEFDDKALSSRSFGQVHRARLREDGREVVVRVRAPDAVQRIATDRRYLGILQFLFEHLDLEPDLHWNDLLFEVKKTTDDLLDFRSEVTELRRARRILRRRRIYVPMVFRRLCTEKVLVVEYIRGVHVEDLQRVAREDPERLDSWMRENNIRARRVWHRLFNAHNELLFENNLFFTELLPNSIMLLRDNRLALVSLGTLGTLDADLQSKYRRFYRAVLESDYTKVCDIFLTMGPALPYKDTTKMKQSASRVLRKWESQTHVKQVPYSQKSLDAALGELTRCATTQGLPTSWNLTRLRSAERILNMSLDFLDPTKSSIKVLRRYERSAQYRVIRQAATKRVRKRINNATDAGRLAMQQMENLEHDGDYLRGRLQSVQSKLSKVSAIGGRLVVMVTRLAMAIVVIGVFRFLRQDVPLAEQGSTGRFLSVLRTQSWAAWLVLLLLVFYGRRVMGGLARQLFSKEVRPKDTL